MMKLEKPRITRRTIGRVLVVLGIAYLAYVVAMISRVLDQLNGLAGTHLSLFAILVAIGIVVAGLIMIRDN